MLEYTVLEAVPEEQAMELTQEGPETVFYAINLGDGLISKGHTVMQGHVVRSPLGFALITDSREEWKLFGEEETAPEDDE